MAVKDTHPTFTHKLERNSARVCLWVCKVGPFWLLPTSSKSVCVCLCVCVSDSALLRSRHEPFCTCTCFSSSLCEDLGSIFAAVTIMPCSQSHIKEEKKKSGFRVKMPWNRGNKLPLLQIIIMKIFINCCISSLVPLHLAVIFSAWVLPFSDPWFPLPSRPC